MDELSAAGVGGIGDWRMRLVVLVLCGSRFFIWVDRTVGKYANYLSEVEQSRCSYYTYISC